MTRAELKAKLDELILEEATPAERVAIKTPGYDETVYHPVRKIKSELGPTVQDLYDRFKWTKDEIASWLDVDQDFINTMIHWEEQ